MASLWKKPANDYESSAKVVDGNLILSLPDAINPVVWRMELGSVKASALEVRNQAADGSFMLFLKTPKGEVHDIAPYAERQSAVNALMRVSTALQNAEGKIAQVQHANHIAAVQTPPPAKQNEESSLKWIYIIGGALIVVVLFAYLGSLQPQTGSMGTEQTATTITGESNAESGVPQSADEMLKGF